MGCKRAGEKKQIREKINQKELKDADNNKEAEQERKNNMSTLIRFLKEEEGIGTVEMILILVVLITLVIIFKDQLTALVNDIFSQITTKSSSIY